MTLNQMLFSAWSDFLVAYYHCYPDTKGNRPCDNGSLCDKCAMTKTTQKLWEEFRIKWFADYKNGS